MLWISAFSVRTARQVFATTILLLLITLRVVVADGFRNPPPDAAGLGRAGVFVAHVDNVSAISYNPASLSLLSRPEAGVAVTCARTKTEFEGPAGSCTSEDPWQILPNVYAAWPIGGSAMKWAVGLGLTTPYGQAVEWEKESVFRYFAPHYARMRVLNVNPAVSARLGERLYAGLGGDMFLSDVQFKAEADNGSAPGEGFLKLDGEGVGWGAHAGLLCLLSAGQRLAVSVHSPVSVDYEGEAHLRNLPVPFPARADFETRLDFPTAVALGYGITWREVVRLEFDVEWLEFSRNEAIRLETGAYGALVPSSWPQRWDDTWTAGVAGDWQFRPGWVLRAVYAFLESPVPDDTFSPTLPDADRHVVSIGLGRATGPHRLDLACSWSFYEQREIRQHPVAALNGDYEIRSDLLGVSYRRAF